MLARSGVFAAIAAWVITFAWPVAAQVAKPGTWAKIAVQEVRAATGEAVFDLPSRGTTWRALRLEVKGGDLTIQRVEVRYAGDARYTETRLISLLEGERTRPLDPGADRIISRVTVVYQRDGERTSMPVLELWGQRGSDSPNSGQPTAEKVVEAPGNREVLIGVQRPGYRDETDGFTVGEVGRFSRLQLKIHDNEVHIAQVLVFYSDGETQTVSLDQRIARGGSSGWIPVKEEQFIRRVEVLYKSRPSLRGPARVELVGELAAGWLGPRGPGRDFNGGWVLLGAQTAGFVGFDRDLIPVGINEGGFRNLRVTVRDRAVTLDELRVVYGRGGAQVIRLGQRVQPGEAVGPIALDPERAIVEIRARYRSRYFDRTATGWRPAIVEVWGQH
jgi:hypothetical protein